MRAKIRARVRDPEIAELLSPTNTIGCKRLCVDIGYYETFNRPNVTLIDVSERPIEAITPEGVKAHGREHKVDAIVFATGFDAMTGRAATRSTSAAAAACRCARSGAPARAPIWASAWRASPTSSRSPARAARRC